MITQIIGFSAFFVIAFIFLIILMRRSIYLVRQAEAVIIERLGKFDRILQPGLHFIAPFIERPRSVIWSYVKQIDGKRYHRFIENINRIDLRESVHDFPKQNVITKDNVTMEISALLYYHITDPRASFYEVANLPEAIEKLTQTTLRNIIGAMDLDESLVSRDLINEKLRLILDEAADKWGVKVTRVELQEVNPPEDIRQAMEKQMRAERDRRALILEAEGTKRAAILEAEGIRESNVLKARGNSESTVLMAEAEATARLKMAHAESQALELIQKAAPKGDALAYLTAINYIKMLPEMTKGKNDKMIVIPYEASALMGSITAIKKIFEETKPDNRSIKD
jgi:regulator of protease activity HflC (stomatin/prohibitin superfamily)